MNISPKTLTKVHLVLMGFWVLVTPVTFKFPESVLWVAFMSQYANFVGHFAGMDASRSELALREELADVKQELADIKGLLAA